MVHPSHPGIVEVALVLEVITRIARHSLQAASEVGGREGGREVEREGEREGGREKGREKEGEGGRGREKMRLDTILCTVYTVYVRGTGGGVSEVDGYSVQRLPPTGVEPPTRWVDCCYGNAMETSPTHHSSPLPPIHRGRNPRRCVVQPTSPPRVSHDTYPGSLLIQPLSDTRTGTDNSPVLPIQCIIMLVS